MHGIVIYVIARGIVIVNVARAGIVILIGSVTHTDIICDGLFVLASTCLFLAATL